MQKYDRCKPEWGLSTFGILADTLKETGFVREVLAFYIDDLSQRLGQPIMDELLLQICASERPDLVVFVPTGWLHIDPSRSTMHTITETLGIKVYMVRDDPGGIEGKRFNESWFPFVSFIGFIDVSVPSLGYDGNPKAIQAFGCLDTRHFYDKGMQRDIDVSFAGSIGNWLHRAEYIQFLRQHGINVTTVGGLEYETRVPIEEYSNIICRSKISLSFCLHRTEGFPQIKRRVFDIMCCKTCLFEDAGTETKKFFEPGRDFVMYEGKEDLLEKVSYYLGHNAEREAIAESGYRKATDLYSARNLWAHILEKTGFGLPDEITQDKSYQELSRKLEAIRRGRGC
jgi:hypothetical protein